ncbi:hypothetical protein ACLOJK_024985 [Asimina triloba]
MEIHRRYAVPTGSPPHMDYAENPSASPPSLPWSRSFATVRSTIRPRYRQIHAVSIRFGHLLHHRLVVPTRNLSELQLLPCTAAGDRSTADLLRPTTPPRHADQRRRLGACCRDLISASHCLYDYAASIIACHFREPRLMHASVSMQPAMPDPTICPNHMPSTMTLIPLVGL